MRMWAPIAKRLPRSRPASSIGERVSGPTTGSRRASAIVADQRAAPFLDHPPNCPDWRLSNRWAYVSAENRRSGEADVALSHSASETRDPRAIVRLHDPPAT